MLNDRHHFFPGRITSSDAGTYNVQLEGKGEGVAALLQGIPIAGIFSNILGFKESVVYPVGSTVLCYSINASSCYLLGIIPPTDANNTSFFSRASLGTFDGKFDSQNTEGYSSLYTKFNTHNQNRPTDVLEGDYVIGNEFGVLLGLFQQMATLKGSELAQIQCYLLDDFVRLVSHNFQHLTALGELNVWHDGKAIISELGATHLSKESLGVPNVTKNETRTFEAEEEPYTSVDDQKDYYKFLNDNRTKAIERLKVFTGRLGDFINMFIVRPDPEAIRALAGVIEGKYDKGLFNVHVSVDGRLSVRSVTGISIEKTNWIMVPHRVRTPEDPQGDEDVSFDDKDPFIFDNSINYRGNPIMYYLQLRDCTAYLQDYYSYQNFLKYEKDFKLSKGPFKNETSLDEIKEVDPQTKVDYSKFRLRRSGIYLMDNGGILIKDAFDSAIAMEGGKIYLQPSTDLVAQPLRNWINKVGQNYVLNVNNEIDLSTTVGGFRLKTAGVQHFFSDEQGIILQSNAQGPSTPLPEDEAYTSCGGIVLKADNAGVYTYGNVIYDRAITSSLYKSDQNIAIKGDEVLYLLGKTLLSNPEVLNFHANEMILYAEGSMLCAGEGATVIGFEGQNPVKPVPDQPFPSIQEGLLTTPLESLDDVKPEDWVKPYDDDAKFTGIKFRFLKSERYLLEDSDFIPMSIAQQTDQAFNILNLTAWTEKEVSGTLPFPGKERFDNFYVTSEIQNLQTHNGDVYSKDSEELSKEANALEFKSLNQYKIYGR